MSKIKSNHVFTSESVSEGHPDKICDCVSDAILDACLEKDKLSRVACETMVSTNFLVNSGEITCSKWNEINPEVIARKVVEDIGYNKEEYCFSHNSFEYLNRLHGQSPDISQGVTKNEGLDKEQGAGDQGMVFGYATNETETLMPAPIAYSHKLLLGFTESRNKKEIAYLRPDSKGQVSIRYINGKPSEITSVVVSHQTDDVSLEMIRKDFILKIKDILGNTGLLTNDTKYYVNPTGRFVIGGPHGDAGLTGRKVIVDTYGGIGSHGGGAFSGKDPSKVDRSAAYYARYVAKNIVAAGLADKCEIQASYVIGVSDPVSINIDTYGTAKVAEAKIESILNSKEIFNFRPADLIKNLGLLKFNQNWSYKQTSSYGHFGRDFFPWEKTDKIEALRSIIK